MSLPLDITVWHAALVSQGMLNVCGPRQLVLRSVTDHWYGGRCPRAFSPHVQGLESVKIRLEVPLVIQTLHTGHLGNHVTLLIFSRLRPQLLVERFPRHWRQRILN